MAQVSQPLQFKRLYQGPLDPTSVHATLTAATEYALSPTAYAGQILGVQNGTNTPDAYIINENRTLTKVGTGGGTGGVTEEEVNTKIATHNVTVSAHQDIRNHISTLESDKASTEDLQAHEANTTKHINIGERDTWNNKQDRLVAGTNITITNNVISSAGGGGTGSVDNKTIRFNQDSKLEAIGTIEKNLNLTKYDWIGTKQEWEDGRADSTIPDDWICYITDDVNASTFLPEAIIFLDNRTRNKQVFYVPRDYSIEEVINDIIPNGSFNECTISLTDDITVSASLNVIGGVTPQLIKIQGNGYTITTSSNITIFNVYQNCNIQFLSTIFTSLVSGQASAIIANHSQLRVEGCTFNGFLRAIHTTQASRSYIVNCTFNTCTQGVYLLWASIGSLNVGTFNTCTNPIMCLRASTLSCLGAINIVTSTLAVQANYNSYMTFDTAPVFGANVSTQFSPNKNVVGNSNSYIQAP